MGRFATFAPYGKAIIGSVVTGLTALGGYLINDTSLGDITAGQWVYVVVAFLVALGAIWAIPNKKETS